MTCQLSPLTFWPDTRDLTSGASKAGHRAPPDYKVLNVGRRDSLHTGWTALVLEETGRSGKTADTLQLISLQIPPPQPFHFSLFETFPHKSSSFQTPYDFTQHKIHLCYSQMDLESHQQAFHNHNEICSRFAFQIQTSD